jgi:hypothetical protein
VLSHMIGVPLAIRLIDIALWPHFPAESRSQELVSRPHQVEPSGNATGR